MVGGLLGEQVVDTIRVGSDAAAGDQGMGVLLLQQAGDALLQAGQLAVLGKVAGQLGQQAAEGRPHQGLQEDGRKVRYLRLGIDYRQQQLPQRQVEVGQLRQGGQPLAWLQRRQRGQHLVECLFGRMSLGDAALQQGAEQAGSQGLAIQSGGRMQQRRRRRGWQEQQRTGQQGGGGAAQLTGTGYAADAGLPLVTAGVLVEIDAQGATLGQIDVQGIGRCRQRRFIRAAATAGGEQGGQQAGQAGIGWIHLLSLGRGQGPFFLYMGGLLSRAGEGGARSPAAAARAGWPHRRHCCRPPESG